MEAQKDIGKEHRWLLRQTLKFSTGVHLGRPCKQQRTKCLSAQSQGCGQTNDSSKLYNCNRHPEEATPKLRLCSSCEMTLASNNTRWQPWRWVGTGASWHIEVLNDHFWWYVFGQHFNGSLIYFGSGCYSVWHSNIAISAINGVEVLYAEMQTWHRVWKNALGIVDLSSFSVFNG